MGRKRVVPSSQTKDKIIPLVGDVLKIIGAASVIGAVVVLPATAVIIKPILKFAKEKLDESEEIKNAKFDKVRLWLILRRLEKQQVVELSQNLNGETEVKLTKKGRVRCLRAKLKEMPGNFTRRSWDGRWRIIVFDVPEKERVRRDNFRVFLSQLKFYQLQESVYLAPYPCEGEIEFLRQYYGLGKKVQILVVSGLEDDDAYKVYFGIK